MDPDEIKKIINNPNKESLTIDFKKSDVLKEDGLKKLLKHIVSFANRNGGIILIGILIVMIGLFLSNPLNLSSFFFGRSNSRGYHFFY